MAKKDRRVIASSEKMWALAGSLLGGVVGGLVVWVFQGHTLSVRAEGITYAELAAILLGAVSVLVAIFGVLMAVLALWGYRHFKNVAKQASTDIAKKVAGEEVLREMREGTAGSVIDQKVLEAIDAMSEGKYEAWREERSVQTERMDDLDRDDADG